ncbi:MAG: flagellar export chaperone FliS [Dehalococcoidia bacterium]
MQPNPYGAYRRVQTQTASPAQLVLHLYEALLRDLARAEQQLAVPDLEAAHSSLVHAQDIVMELVAGLDLDAGEIAQQLADLYQYMYGRLIEANVRKDRRAIHEVFSLVERIHAAWEQVVQSTPSMPQPEMTRSVRV